jgi:hypothetical protein
MKKCTAYACLLVGLMLVCQAAAACPNADTLKKDADPYEHASYFMYGFDYLSNYIYLGRKDTVPLPYYTPYIGYHMANGLYAKVMASYTTAGRGRWDLLTLEAAYDHTFGSFAVGGYADKYFYNKASNSVKSACKAAAGVYVQYTNDYIEPLFSADVIQNAQSRDFVLGFKADHEFTAVKEKLSIVPTVGYIIGQRHYYNDYLIKSIKKGNKAANIDVVMPAANRMVPLVYELSIECSYVANKWLFTLLPTYAIPQSPASLTIFNRTFQETLSNTFYLELDVRHR